MKWKDQKILITGGASFIGSHLVDFLVGKALQVRVVDDLSSGRFKNISGHIKTKKIEFIKGDLLEQQVVKNAVKNIDLIFHLAAVHGGRGYVDLHQGVMVKNIHMDAMIVREAQKAGVGKIVFASSGCVYPNYLQQNTREKLYLNEGKGGPPYDPDNMYGWAKLTTEKMLEAYCRDFGLKSVSCRFFTVYGPRGVENHAVMAMIARAFIRENPYEVWGDGTQIRNWTYVTDIVEGMVKAADRIGDGSAVNLGTTERIRVIDAVNEILKYTNFRPRIVFKKSMPVGPLNRVCDNSLAKKLFGWEPKVKFFDGLHHTIDWYFAEKKVKQVKASLPSLLTELP